jgi:hypothetical protein
MIAILSSTAKNPSDDFKEEVPRNKDEDNISWLARNMPAGDVTYLCLVGGKSLTAFRLRVAQAHLRHDLVPSNWSHVFLLKPAKNLAASSIVEISLEPEKGFGFPTPVNAVQNGRLSAYRDPNLYPNIAVLGVPVAQKEVLSALKRFQMQRAVLDAVDLVVKWLGFAWGVSRSTNPLMDGHGIPSSAMLETVFGAAGFDLTPGLESRSSCPEAIWQAAKWWYEYYERDNRPSITGACFAPHLIFTEAYDRKS